MSQSTRKENKKYGADRLHRTLVSLHNQLEITANLIASKVIPITHHEYLAGIKVWILSMSGLTEKRLIV
jgi:hypothetical protein